MKRFVTLLLAFMLLLCGCSAAPADGDDVQANPNSDENVDVEETKERPTFGPDDKLIALSFDDGPCLGSTNALLDYFEEMDIVGTFFVIGDRIDDETAEAMKRAVSLNCEIGNHSKTHQQMGNMTAEQLIEEIDYVQDKVYEYTGTTPVLFRPPFLNVSQTMYDNISQTFIFGRDSLDWTGISAEERAENIMNHAADGVIILMHDGWDNYDTVEAVKIVVPQLIEQGYQFVTISELFEAKGTVPEAHSGVIYSTATGK